jgi:hypothetical protein
MSQHPKRRQPAATTPTPQKRHPRLARESAFPPVTGTGYLTYPDGTRIECDFRLTRRSAGGTSLRCERAIDPGKMGMVMFGGPMPDRFHGEAADGTIVTVEGGMILHDESRIDMRDAEKSFLQYDCTNAALRMVTPDRRGDLRASFAMVNLVFDAAERVDYTTAAGHEGWRRARTTLALGNRAVTLTQLGDYKTRVERLKARGGNIVTTIAEATATSPEDLRVLVEEINDLGYLLTLATSNPVSCATYTAWNAASRRRICTETFDPPEKSYGGLPLARRNDAGEFKTFIEATYPVYRARRDEYQLGRVAHARVDAVAGGFLETRALLTSVLVEFLANAYATRNGYTTPLAPERFRGILPTLRETVGKAIRNEVPEADAETIERLVAGVGGLNNAGFRDRLRFTADRLGTGITADDIKAVILTRQRLAHEMRFANQRVEHRQWNEYRRVLHVADRIILRLLDYTGPYTNVETLERAVLANPHAVTDGLTKEPRVQSL